MTEADMKPAKQHIEWFCDRFGVDPVTHEIFVILGELPVKEREIFIEALKSYRDRKIGFEHALERAHDKIMELRAA